ncbi:MAG TPA: HesB/YadR/YfhF family protein [Bacillota bacterium]|nr:HesB/YadR/YfhF family protein [Bacillota bacterium]
MKIHMSEEAAKWYKEEMLLENGDFVRFFPRYGGVGGNIPGFSIGIKSDTPNQIAAKVTLSEITFYIENDDLWYFDKKDLKVNFNDKLNEPEYSYV